MSTNEELIEQIKGYWNNIQRLTNDMYIRPNKLSTEELMAEFEYPQSRPVDSEKRLNDTPKGLGYFGAIPTKNGGTMTELSMGTPGDPSETFAPIINPLLSREEIDSLAAGEKPTREIYRKAQMHAKDRIEQGLSPFAGPDEVRPIPDKIVKENSMKLDVFLKKLATTKVELPDAKGEKKEVDINATKVVKSALDSFLKRAAEFLPEGVDAKQLEMGREVEKEHKKTYDQIVDFYNKNNSLPSFEQVAEWIALDHLNEPGNEEYYSKLQTIEKKAGVADFLKRLGTKTKPEQKPEGLLKLIADIKPKEDPMQQLLQHEISKGGSIR